SWSLGSVCVREAPACVAPAATSKSRFRRSKLDGHADAGHFFYPWPLLAQPAADFPLVLFAGLPLRLLGSNSTLGQPLIDVVRMKLLAELASNQLGHPRCGPQFGGKAELARRLAEPPQHRLLLPGRQRRRSARCGL